MLVLRSTRMVFPDAERPAAIHIENGIIERIVDHASDDPTGARVFDAGGLTVSPGVVDTHVHINEPGRTTWEGFESATRAAAAGGVTTLVDMPLNSIPATTNVAALQAKRDAALAQCHVDVAFWGGVVPGNAGALDALVDAGVRGFKCFLVPSGVEEFPAVGEDDLREALPVLARRNVPLLVHAESPALIGSPERLALQEKPGARGFQPSVYATYLATRPAEAEVEAIRLMVRLAAEYMAHVHIVHVSSAEAVETIASARAASVPITAETCPHYLTFDAGEIADGATEFKCAPPIRAALHRDALWRGLGRGVLDLIATDHSPSPPELKRPGGAGDFVTAWGGIASLELSLAATWTGFNSYVGRGVSWAEGDTAEAAPYTSGGATAASSVEPSPLSVEHSTLSPLCRLAHWLSAAPAALAGLGTRKGQIAPGFDADLVVWDPGAAYVVDASTLHQRHKLTPYAGRSLTGRVATTFSRGERLWDRNRLTRAYGGRLL
jgi:allantoinase